MVENIESPGSHFRPQIRHKL